MSSLLLALTSTATALALPPVEEFGDWTVACDNIRHCEAVAAFEYSGRDNEWVLLVQREPDADAQPVVFAIPAFDDPRTARIRMDGEPTPFRIAGDGDLVGDPADFLAAVAQASEVEAIGPFGDRIGVLSASGASAALRWIDAQQLRADTVTAVVATGSRPSSAVPAPPPLPQIVQPERGTAAPRSLDDATVAAIREYGDCDYDAVEAVETFRLDAGHTIGMVGCIRGAYQGSSVVVVIAEDGQWVPAPLEWPDDHFEDVPPEWRSSLVWPAYLEDVGLLATFAKARGLADCGMGASWAWDGEVFRLARFSQLYTCRGAPPGTTLSRWQTANDPLSRYEGE